MDMLEIQRAIRSGLKPLEALPPAWLSDWAAGHFYLSAESSYVEKKWEAYPYQVAILDCMGDDDIEEVTVKKSARIGYTKMLLAAIGYFAHQKRRNQAVWQPTDEDSDEFVKTDLEPMFRDVPAMRRVLPMRMRRHRNNTLRQKLFLGSILHLRGGKAAKNYRRLTVSVAILDEVDGFDRDIEGEGNPVELARKRLEGATFPKLIVGSTPKTKSISHVEACEGNAQKRYRYHIPCPHCGVEHTLRWGGADKKYGFRSTGDDPENLVVSHLCEACGVVYSQADYLRVWWQGRWIAQDGSYIGVDKRFHAADGTRLPTPRSVAFSIWTAYSPQAEWSAIVRQYLAAEKKAAGGDKGELKTFINLTLGETYEEEIQQADETQLKGRAEAFPLRVVPMGALELVAGVDTQDDRFEIRVWGIGRGQEMWTVDHKTIDANPADERDWARLDEYLLTQFPHAAGTRVGIKGVAIDTGGHFTHQVYNFCRQRTARRIFAVRGETKEGQPVRSRSSSQDVNFRGKILKAGVKLWHVGTDTAKDLFFGRLSVKRPGPGYVHFSKDLPDEFYSELTAEGRVKQKTATGEVFRWVQIRARNETLDCTVYAIFVSHMLGHDTNTDWKWERIEAVVQPMNRDLFHVPPPPVSPEPSVATPTEVPRETPAAAPLQTSARPATPRSRASLASSEWDSRL